MGDIETNLGKPVNNPRGENALSRHFQSSRSQDEKLILSWEDIRYSALIKDPSKSKPFNTVYKERHILRGLSGYATSGELVAILGPTGCGKTSLLNILAARCPSGDMGKIRLNGEIKVNGAKRDESAFRKISAYVLQDDYLYPHLTVLETITLAGKFFLPTNMPLEEKTELIDLIIQELSLNKARDTIIGDDKLRGVSGGERKRCAIAVQLISDPAVLFLDEPTSGLDSFQALAVMESMKTLASSGRLVMTVIHQPRSSIFNMFDKLLLLSEGRTMYFGSAVGNSVEHFTSLGYKCPSTFNPADFFLDLLSPDNRTPELEESSSAIIKNVGNMWLKTGAPASASALANLLKAQEAASSNGRPAVRTLQESKIDFVKTRRNLVLLAWRAWIEQSRDIATMAIKLIFTCFFSLVVGGIYSNIGNSQQSIQNRVGLLFFIVLNNTFGPLIAVLNSFPKEKTIVNRERSARAYDTTSYFFSKVIVEIPLNALPALIYACIVYWIVQLQPERFGYFILILMFHTVLAVSLGIFASTISPTVEVANAIGTPMVIIGVLFGGFYISVKSLPIVSDWIPYISVVRWTFQALCINEFRGLTFTCYDAASPQSCIHTGEQELSYLDFGDHSTAYAVFGMGMLLLAFLAMSYVRLLNSKMTYLPLGHTGSYFAKNASSADASNGGDEAALFTIDVADRVSSSNESDGQTTAVASKDGTGDASGVEMKSTQQIP